MCALLGPTTSVDAEQTHVNFEMILISFLMTENHACPEMGALFYFAQPKPWQLHQVIKLCSSSLESEWLDSPMNDPSQQRLGTRVGTASGAPSVLIGIKQ